MKARVLLVVLVIAGVAWLAGDRLAGWVRPVALAVFAGSLALLLWPRIGGRSRRPSQRAEVAEPTSKELWDALDRGEDPTDPPR
jgi:hypothetical protein